MHCAIDHAPGGGMPVELLVAERRDKRVRGGGELLELLAEVFDFWRQRQRIRGGHQADCSGFMSESAGCCSLFCTFTLSREATMYVVRDIMYCKPGQVRPMVQKFLALSKLIAKMGFSGMRVMTDVCAERYWTVVAEIEVKSLEEYAETSRKSMQDKEFQEAMKGYHDLIVEGRREIYTLES